MTKVLNLILTAAFALFAINFSIGQTTKADPSNLEKNNKDSTNKEGGVAVSPAHIYFNCKPGEKKTTTLKVSNNMKTAKKFELKFTDSDMNEKGKPSASKERANTLSNWITFSPTFFEVLPGTAQIVTVALNVPDVPEAYRAKWGLLYVNQVIERKTIDITPGDNKIGMGVVPSFGFGISIYQNPPNVAVKKVEIQGLANITKAGEDHVVIQLKAKNTGDGISFCTTYAEIVNSKNGKKQKFGKKSFTALPGHERVFNFDLPKDLEKGHYTCIGVLDFGSKEELEAAELEFDVR
jgi:hypothetical protein